MFGYVRVYKPELRMKEYEMYKALYCTICKQIGKEYGLITRFSLSYDFTFLMMLYLSLRDDCISTKKGKCIYNPLKSCNYIKGELPKMPLAAAEMMLYFKLCDNISDEGFLKSFVARFLRFFSKKGFKKASQEFPELCEVFENYSREQQRVEKENTNTIDIAAEPTAKMLSKLFSLCAVDDNKRALERMGYCLGRWIYVLDAAADLTEDIKKGSFNPLKERVKNEENIAEFLKINLSESLMFNITEMAAAFELVDILRFKNILGNIIYLGLENTQNEILEKEKCKK